MDDEPQALDDAALVTTTTPLIVDDTITVGAAVMMLAMPHILCYIAVTSAAMAMVPHVDTVVAGEAMAMVLHVNITVAGAEMVMVTYVLDSLVEDSAKMPALSDGAGQEK